MFQAEGSVCKDPGVQMSLPGVYVWAGTRLEMECEGNEAGEVFGGQVLNFSEPPMDKNIVVTLRLVNEIVGKMKINQIE